MLQLCTNTSRICENVGAGLLVGQDHPGSWYMGAKRVCRALCPALLAGIVTSADA